MKAGVIFIGSELLKGHRNSDAEYLGARFDDAGIESEFYVVADKSDEIVEILNFAFLRNDFLITVGGLGPTFDDKTVDAVCAFIGKKRVLDKKTLQNVADYYINRGIDVPKIAERQAYVIEGATVIQNETGTAPAQIVKFKNSEIILLPGPPRELKSFFEKKIFPRIKKKIPGVFYRKKRFHLIGLTEAEAAARISPVVSVEKYSGLSAEFSILAHQPVVDVSFRISGRDEILVNEREHLLEKEMRAALGDYIFGFDGETLAYVCGRQLSKKGKTLSSAESCTGGEIADMITDVKGASLFFELGVVVYTKEEKRKVLGIPSAEIQKHGVVSERIAALMAESVLKMSGSDYGISTTGVAGPGDSEGVAQGTVYIGIASASGTSVRKFVFSGTRKEVKKIASLTALDCLRRKLK
ncbi:MAG: CinA family nicotinamide mononucleotide deamidase-related protein [Elusimicrobia bacterium]|nr:CinA family nicotinamide mononucleotide deamidase-related protein [Elusimicrobiota bacterium]